MTCTFTRFQATCAGCALAVVSWLLAPASHSELPHQGACQLPDTIGSWKLLEEVALAESELRILEASDHWRRIYQDPDTKCAVDVTVVVGASGPLASHRPEICYSRREFSLHGDAWLWTVPDRGDTFCFQSFAPRQVEQPALTIAYAWHDGVRWRVPRFPRLELASHAVVQRLQITMRHPHGLAPDARVAMQQFLQLALEAADVEKSSRAPALCAQTFPGREEQDRKTGDPQRIRVP